ncbi:hypothetical protein T4B_2452 [Trichinella pseudospiralis]|uniref:Uncharacterized protein n=1 Tax=Trichinella pseudospiralis TaxID=6337 RepID=A0A0V1IKS8_TRIPS|nr:hypothetical protein T4B_2452 [Trichinella pseudospiralis]KRZ28613.1 hypothetical protein T4C_3212 [Trichinella pseudospiralis]
MHVQQHQTAKDGKVSKSRPLKKSRLRRRLGWVSVTLAVDKFEQSFCTLCMAKSSAFAIFGKHICTISGLINTAVNSSTTSKQRNGFSKIATNVVKAKSKAEARDSNIILQN